MLYDKDIREPLFDFFEDQYGKTRVIEEKRMGNSRADVVIVIENALIGVEIKSNADTYTRLAGQVKDYDLFFDYNYVVVGSRHAMHVEEHVPKHWGIITVDEQDGKTDFYILKAPSKNPNMLLREKLGMLWRPELAHIQELTGMHKYSQESKAFVIDKILLHVSEENIQKYISEELFERDYTTIAKRISEYRKEKGLKKRRKKRISKRYRISR